MPEGVFFPLGAGRGLAAYTPGRAPCSSKAQIDPGILALPVTHLPGVGRAVAARLATVGIRTLSELLLYLPFRHETPARLCSVADLRVGETATLRVQVVSSSVRQARRRNLKILEALVSDNTGSILAIWYNQSHLQDAFSKKPEVLVRGTLTHRQGPPRVVVQSYEILGDAQGGGLHTLGFIPVYPASGDVSVRLIRNTVAKAKPYAQHLVDPLPPSLLAERRYPSRGEAVLGCHFPRSLNEARVARERLAFEELLLLEIALLRRRARAKKWAAVPLEPPGGLTAAFLAALPYTPTRAQRRVMGELESDLQSGRPMLRLLQGDVGSGKTLIATYALVRAVENGGQAALMAPTEVLADQHALRLDDVLSPLGVKVALLKNSLPTGAKRNVLRGLARGDISLVVGTHALIQSAVDFKNLQVAVIDEQHRFGVRQRDALGTAAGSSARPHVLHMTATPIPRTLSLTLYGDLDVSVLDELPPGRRPVRTHLVREGGEGAAWELVRERLSAGEQAYVVCPLIEEGEAQVDLAATAVYAQLAAGELRGYRLGLLHGALPSATKQQVMKDFAQGSIDALVTTTVIEVGVDVPNATVMVVLGANRFGLSQLHQLRGRVGRGKRSSYCLLFAGGENAEAEARLRLFASTSDGFALAEADLKLRGEGQVFGERQSGLSDLKVARLWRDQRLLVEARAAAETLLRRGEGDQDPALRLLVEAAQKQFAAVEHWLDRA